VDSSSTFFFSFLNRDTYDRNVRLFWQESRQITSVTPDFLDRQLTEWKLDSALNSLSRMPKIPGGVLGSYNGVVLRLFMEREESFYLIKVLSIIVMLTGTYKKKYFFFFFFNLTIIIFFYVGSR
jgi:hypothetical protein